MSEWIVVKFGGTSVSQAQTWDSIVKHVKSLLAESPRQKVWVVVSALAQVTNQLEKCFQDVDNYKTYFNWIVNRHYQLAQDIGDPELVGPEIKEQFEILDKLLTGLQMTGETPSSRLCAKIYSFGEIFSSRMGHSIMKKLIDETEVSWVDARTCLFAENRPNQTIEDKYLSAHVPPKLAPEIAEAQLKPSSRVAITQGFIAQTKASSKGSKAGTCILGRGGGDISGGLFGALLGAKRVEIWTDVHGMFTSDPRYVEQARHIRELSYREAQELAAMGAKVLHPRSVAPCAFAKIPILILNTMDFGNKNSNKCTRIVSQEALQDKQTTVMAIARRRNIVLITLTTMDMWGASGFLSRAFAPFDRHGVSVDLIATSQYAVSLTLDYIPGGKDGDVFAALLRDLEEVAEVKVHYNCAVVSIVGRRLRSVLHEMADAFKELAQYEVLLLSESTEDMNLSFVINEQETDENGRNISDFQTVDTLVSKLHKVLLEDRQSFIQPSRSSPSLFGETLSQLTSNSDE